MLDGFSARAQRAGDGIVMRVRNMGLFSVLCVVGCSSGAAPSASEDPVKAKDQPLFIDTGATWDSPHIPVCWEDSPPDMIEHQWVSDALRGAWAAYSQVTFDDRGKCAVADGGIHIRVSDERPHTSSLGDHLDGDTTGMILNFTFKNWSPGLANDPEYGIRAIAVHEFGHALSFEHEQNRGDHPDFAIPGGSTFLNLGPHADTFVGPWDYDSVMDYCNPVWNGNGVLSANDVNGVRSVYGARNVRVPTWEAGQLDMVTLAPGQTLLPGQTLWSSTNRYRLTLQTDGNLVLYDTVWAADASQRRDANEGCNFSGNFESMPIWNSRTAGSGATRVTMQTDGNLVIYNGTTPVWHSHTPGHPGVSMSFQTDGNLVIYERQAVWQSGTPVAAPDARATSLESGQSLRRGQQLVSPSGRFTLRMQTDGRAVLYDGLKPLWASSAGPTDGDTLSMQSDGNLVIYGPSGPSWYTRTDVRNDGDRAFPTLSLQNDGNLVIYRPVAIWNSGSENTFGIAGAAELGPGQTLPIGSQLTTAAGNFSLLLDATGNLIEQRADGSLFWSANTGGLGAVRAVMRLNGDFVLENLAHATVWQAPTAGYFQSSTGGIGSYLALRQDGTLAVNQPGRLPVWDSKQVRRPGTAVTLFRQGDRLASGARLSSPNGLTQMIMQSDGNLVLSDGATTYWSTGTAGHPGAYAAMQTDDVTHSTGNFAVYAANGTVLWQTSTFGARGTYIAIQDDGNLVLYRPSEIVVGTVQTPVPGWFAVLDAAVISQLTSEN